MSPTLHHLLALAVCLSLAGCALLALAALGAKFARRVPKLGLWHLPCPVLAALLALAVVAATRSDKNGTNGAARARAPARSPLALASDDAPRVAAIAVTDAGVDLVLHRPAADSALAAAVTVAGSSNYAPGGWEALLDASFATGDTEADVAVPAATLAQHGISDLGFFAFATAGDSDGDGLADWFELLNSRTRGGMRETCGIGRC